jgi:hypothetical protein
VSSLSFDVVTSPVIAAFSVVVIKLIAVVAVSDCCAVVITSLAMATLSDVVVIYTNCSNS